MRNWLLTVAAAITLSAPGLAADEQAQPDPQKKICKTERTTGSLTRSRRICMTRAEWDQLSRDTQKDLADIQRNAGAIPRTLNTDPNQPVPGGMTAGFQ